MSCFADRRDASPAGGLPPPPRWWLATANRANAAPWEADPIQEPSSGVCASAAAKDIPGTLKGGRALGYQPSKLENAFGRSGASGKTHLDAAKLKGLRLSSSPLPVQGDKLGPSVGVQSDDSGTAT